MTVCPLAYTLVLWERKRKRKEEFEMVTAFVVLVVVAALVACVVWSSFIWGPPDGRMIDGSEILLKFFVSFCGNLGIIYLAFFAISGILSW